jgi:hypothetical protein
MSVPYIVAGQAPALQFSVDGMKKAADESAAFNIAATNSWGW